MTNQASEDDLRTKIKGLNVYRAEVNMHVSYRPDQANLPRFTSSWVGEIESLVRTEKLKLLAEVRERVVGEDQPDIGDSSHERNILRREEREALNKLEAEL